MIRKLIALFYFLLLFIGMIVSSISIVMFGIGLICIICNGIFYREFDKEHLKTAMAGVIMPYDIVLKFIKK